MSNELTAYQNVKDPIAFMSHVGTAIARSKMFGCANEEQGQVLAMACLCENKNPIEITKQYHIIHGKLSMRADAMLAELRLRGGKHKVVSRTPDKAEIEITVGNDSYRESFTWEEAQAERYPYEKDGETLKPNWSTPRGRKQMLWARVCSEAVRVMCPEIVAGVYTPEEVGDSTETAAQHAAAASEPVDAEELIRGSTAKAEEKKIVDIKDEVIDAEFEVVDDEPAKDEQSVEGDSTPGQRKELGRLFEALGANDEQIRKALEKRGCVAFRQLSSMQANELIDSLKSKAQAVAEATAGESEQSSDAKEEAVSGPVGQRVIDDIKNLMRDEPELIKQVKAHLHRHGIDKLAELNHVDAAVLSNALQMKNIELFLERSLVKAEEPIPFDQKKADSGSG